MVNMDLNTPSAVDKEPSQWILKQNIFFKKNLQILDFACGFGRNSIPLAKNNSILAIDKNRDALSYLSKQGKIDTLQCDLENTEEWPFQNLRFDVVIVCNYLHRERLADLMRLVKLGGFLIYETFGIGNEKYGRPKNHKFLLKKGELNALLNDEFEILFDFFGLIKDPKKSIKSKILAKKVNVKND